MHKYLNIAAKNALTHDYDSFVDYRLCAVIATGGNILSIGYNKRKTNAFVEHYTDRIRGNNRDYCLSTHAEMDAIAKIREKIDLTGAKIYVTRLLKPNAPSGMRFGLARPCAICQNVLHAYGIKRAYYTIDDNNYGIMRVTKHRINDQTIRNIK